MPCFISSDRYPLKLLSPAISVLSEAKRSWSSSVSAAKEALRRRTADPLRPDMISKTALKFPSVRHSVATLMRRRMTRARPMRSRSASTDVCTHMETRLNRSMTRIMLGDRKALSRLVHPCPRNSAVSTRRKAAYSMRLSCRAISTGSTSSKDKKAALVGGRRGDGASPDTAISLLDPSLFLDETREVSEAAAAADRGAMVRWTMAASSCWKSGRP
mmetsp:Transcript_4915/g.15883  ORF Transcript_4915/g.15883 Transcript_4915/m.15883 type:complete len:216 (-) Transcript_4915:393-1040(-)